MSDDIINQAVAYFISHVVQTAYSNALIAQLEVTSIESILNSSLKFLVSSDWTSSPIKTSVFTQ